jgi:hypothetical protein
MLLVAICQSLFACGRSHDVCGGADASVMDAHGVYCAYAQPLVIEGGFQCPAMASHRSELGGYVLCTSQPIDVANPPAEVCTMIKGACSDLGMAPGSGGQLPRDLEPDAATSKPKPAGPKCGDTPSQLVDFSAIPNDLGRSGVPLAVDATNIYFVFGHALMSVPIRGGTVATLSVLDALPNLVLADIEPIARTRVILHFVTKDGTNEQIVSIPIEGGDAEVLAVATGDIWGMAADEQNVYFVDEDGLKTIPISGGDARILTDQVAVPHVGGFYGGALAVAGQKLIVTEGRDREALVSVPVDGGPPTTLATGQPNASFPMPCGADICWWSGETPDGVAGTPGPGTIARLDPSGDVMTLPGAPFFPWSLSFDGVDFFETVGCDICDGTLLRIPSAGGPVVQMGEASYAAVDDTCAYWSTRDGIFSVIKSYRAK